MEMLHENFYFRASQIERRMGKVFFDIDEETIRKLLAFTKLRCLMSFSVVKIAKQTQDYRSYLADVISSCEILLLSLLSVDEQPTTGS